VSERETRPAEVRETRALARPSAWQVINLSVGVAGTLGGALLLASNLAVLVVAQAGTVPWLPLGANAALVFGGLMFVREYRRGRDPSR
jgi:hypothetical protein